MASFWSWHLSRYLNEYCLGRFRRRANAKALRQECTWSVCWGPIRWPVGLPGWLSGKESAWDTTEQLHFHFSLSCIGEGNGNLLQCSCLENPRDGGVWWAAVYGVAQGRTRLKRLSSSSSNQRRRHGFDPWVGKIPWRRKWQPTPVFLPGISHG